jgi:hypothetical protein
MKTTQTASRRQAFSVTSQDLETLLTLLDDLPKKSFRAHLDGTSYADLNLADVLSLQNGGRKAVSVLELNAHAPDSYVSIELRDWPYGETVRVYASGEERDVLWRTSQVENWLSAIRPWYDRIATVDFTGFLFASFLVVVGLAYIAAFGLVLWRGTDSPVPESPKTGKDLLVQLAASLVLPALLVLGGALNLIRARVFPIGILEFGGGTKKRIAAERWRTAFGLGFLMSIVASIIAGWIQRYL